MQHLFTTYILQGNFLREICIFIHSGVEICKSIINTQTSCNVYIFEIKQKYTYFYESTECIKMRIDNFCKCMEFLVSNSEDYFFTNYCNIKVHFLFTNPK